MFGGSSEGLLTDGYIFPLFPSADALPCTMLDWIRPKALERIRMLPLHMAGQTKSKHYAPVPEVSIGPDWIPVSFKVWTRTIIMLFEMVDGLRIELSSHGLQPRAIARLAHRP